MVPRMRAKGSAQVVPAGCSCGQYTSASILVLINGIGGRRIWRMIFYIDDRVAEDDELTAAELYSLVIERYPESTVSVFSHESMATFC